MTAGPVQGISQQGITTEFPESRIQASLKVLIVVVAAVAGAALGFLIWPLYYAR